MNATYTPGPWETNTRIHPSDQVFAAGKIVADCKWTPHDPETREANARLIAAAPELLAALQQIADAEYGTDTPKMRATARAALAKIGANATGG